MGKVALCVSKTLRHLTQRPIAVGAFFFNLLKVTQFFLPASVFNYSLDLIAILNHLLFYIIYYYKG